MFGGEDAGRPAFAVVVVNDSDTAVYFAFSQGGPDPAGSFGVIRPGSDFVVGIGNAVVDDAPGGCFEQHLWLGVSRSGQQFEGEDIARYRDDFAIIKDFPAGTCTDQEEVIVDYNGR